MFRNKGGSQHSEVEERALQMVQEAERLEVSVHLIQ